MTNYYNPDEIWDEYMDPEDTGEDYSPGHPNAPMPPW